MNPPPIDEFCSAICPILAAIDCCFGIGGCAWNSSCIALITVASEELIGFHPRTAYPLYSMVTGSSEGCVTEDIMWNLGGT